MTATTALTAQNTLGVDDIHFVPPQFVGQLIDTTLGDVEVDVVKTGIALFILSSRVLPDSAKECWLQQIRFK